MPDPFLYLSASGAAALASAIPFLAISALVMARARRIASINAPASTSVHGTGPQPGSATGWPAACVVAMGLGLAVGSFVLLRRSVWPPSSALERLLTVVIPAVLIIEWIAGLQRVPHWFTWLLRIGLAAMIPRILWHGSVYLSGADSQWEAWQSATAWLLCSVLLASVWGLLGRLAERAPGASLPFGLGLTISSAGLTIMLAGYIEGGAMAFPLTAALLATTGGVWLARTCSDSLPRAKVAADRDTSSNCRSLMNSGGAAILGIGIAGLYGLLFIGHFFGRLSTMTAMTLLLSPLLCWVTEVPFLRHRHPWLVGSLRLAFVAIPLAVVLILAKRDFDRDMAPLLSLLIP